MSLRVQKTLDCLHNIFRTRALSQSIFEREILEIAEKLHLQKLCTVHSVNLRAPSINMRKSKENS